MSIYWFPVLKLGQVCLFPFLCEIRSPKIWSSFVGFENFSLLSKVGIHSQKFWNFLRFVFKSRGIFSTLISAVNLLEAAARSNFPNSPWSLCENLQSLPELFIVHFQNRQSFVYSLGVEHFSHPLRPCCASSAQGRVPYFSAPSPPFPISLCDVLFRPSLFIPLSHSFFSSFPCYRVVSIFKSPLLKFSRFSFILTNSVWFQRLFKPSNLQLNYLKAFNKWESEWVCKQSDIRTEWRRCYCWASLPSVFSMLSTLRKRRKR